VPGWVKSSPFVDDGAGLCRRFYCYVLKPHVPGELAKAMPVLYRFLLNKWYFDELYDWLFVRPALKWLGRFLWKRGDGTVIDGLGPDGISARVLDATSRSSACRPATSTTTPSRC
jgi:NADH-quinone oxidoreductase subunit L